jgi:transcriptional regulator with XRE-family HTH domain
MTNQLIDISARLRTIRRKRTLTLKQIEKMSHGRLGAVSMGAYERGTRALSVSKAIEIADFYQIPLNFLLSGKEAESREAHSLVIDVRELRSLLNNEIAQKKMTIVVISSYLTGILNQRNDFNAQLLSLRVSDAQNISMMLNLTIQQTTSLLQEHKLLITR